MRTFFFKIRLSEKKNGKEVSDVVQHLETLNNSNQLNCDIKGLFDCQHLFVCCCAMVSPAGCMSATAAYISCMSDNGLG